MLSKTKNKPGNIYIGTSGWSYKHWKGTFYPVNLKIKGHFQYYMQYFDTVEINNSFYRLPSKEVFESWRKAVPENFIYVVKASRFITHMKKLKDPTESLSEFLENVSALKNTLGPILFQLPPSWEINIERLHTFLKALPSHFRYVFEFRNQTWYTEEVYNLLREFNCAFCIYELDRHLTPFVITSDFVYIRLHGPGNKYQGSYDESSLQKWANQIKSWSVNKDVFIYFDNDEKAYAAFNAIRLKELIGLQSHTL